MTISKSRVTTDDLGSAREPKAAIGGLAVGNGVRLAAGSTKKYKPRCTCPFVSWYGHRPFCHKYKEPPKLSSAD